MSQHAFPVQGEWHLLLGPLPVSSEHPGGVLSLGKIQLNQGAMQCLCWVMLRCVLGECWAVLVCVLGVCWAILGVSWVCTGLSSGVHRSRARPTPSACVENEGYGCEL